MADEVAAVIPEREIRSLSAGPELLTARLHREASGALQLQLELRFLNDCLAEAGPDVRLAFNPRGNAYAIVTQGMDPTGCPDIYQPTTRSFVLAIPELSGASAVEGLRVVARASSGEPVSSPELAAGGYGATRQRAELLGATGTLATFSFGSIEAHGSGAGYTLRGKLGLAQDCVPSAVRPFLFEIPDGDGVPRHDVIALVIPPRCQSAAATKSFELRVDTPQRNAGRRVRLLNGDQPPVRL